MSFSKTDVKVFCTVTPESSHVHYILLHFPYSVSQKQETDPTHTPGEGGGGKLWKGMNTLGKNNIGHLKVFLPPCVSAAPCAVHDIHRANSSI